MNNLKNKINNKSKVSKNRINNKNKMLMSFEVHYEKNVSKKISKKLILK